MNIQTKASFVRESLSFFRTKKFLIIALAVVGISIVFPLLTSGLGDLMDSMSDIYAEYDIDVSTMTEELGSSASTGIIMSTSGITEIGLIVLLILINSAAGGEQKKRAVIIPKSAGLRSFAYIFPKFIVYPLSAFVIAVIAMFASWIVSVMVFDANDATFGGVLLAGILAGISLMLYTCFHLALGTATGKAGMSAAVCIAASILLSNFFAFSSTGNMYNPFVLTALAKTVIAKGTVSGAEFLDIAVTIVFALALMIVAYFLALFAQNARKIDNRGDEIEL